MVGLERIYEKQKAMTILVNFPRKKIREIIVQMLYSIDLGEANSDIIKMVTSELAIAKRHVSSAFNEASEIYARKSDLDKILTAAAKTTPFGEMSRLEKNIMRLALHEFFSLNQDLSKKNMIITEAIRLTKKFSTPEASKFVNAVLDAILYQDKDTLPEKCPRIQVSNLV